MGWSSCALQSQYLALSPSGSSFSLRSHATAPWTIMSERYDTLRWGTRQAPCAISDDSCVLTAPPGGQTCGHSRPGGGCRAVAIPSAGAGPGGCLGRLSALTMWADAKTQSPMRHVVRRDGGVVQLRPSHMRPLLLEMSMRRMLPRHTLTFPVNRYPSALAADSLANGTWFCGVTLL